jgi:UDP-N-acetylmuramoyl-tripeptide--D-alanyl-D-alanine ligase
VGDEEVLIFEMGEYYPGDIKKLAELVRPDLGIITGINEQHLVKFKTVDRTAATIYELGDWLAQNVTSLALFVNGESELAAQKAEAYGATVYSRKGAGEWEVSAAKTGLEGTNFQLSHGDDKLDVETKLLGLHQIGPLSVVAAIAQRLDLSAQQIQTGLNATKPFEHRLEPRLENDVWTIDDTYNGNPDGFKAAIEFLQGLKGHRRIYVTPGIVELGRASTSVHEMIGRQLAESGIEVIILIENSVTPHIQAGLKEGGYKGKLTTYPDEITALMALPQMTVPGDVVLLQNDWTDNYA